MPYSNLISRTDAAALIPEEVSNELLTNLAAESAAMTLFRQIRLGRAQTRMPVISALPTAYFVNGDTGLKQTTEVNWTNKYLNVEELAAIVPIPENVVADVENDIWGTVRPLLESAIGRALDAAIFFGTNKPASWPTDIVAAATAAGNTAVRGTSTAAQGGLAGDFSTLFATVEADGFTVTGVIAETNYRGLLRQVRSTTGEKLGDVTSQVNTDAAFGVTIRYPMRGLWPTAVSTAEAIAGDFMEGILGVRSDFTWKILDQAVIQDNTGTIIFNLPQQDMVALRVTFRVAWQVANVYNYDQPTEASRYPFAVMLAPAS